MAVCLDDYFAHWEPRDVVGGDYLFFRRFDDGYFLAVIDCTGHGVPGAFMTLIVASYLNNLLSRENRNDPAALMSRMNQAIKLALGQVESARANEKPGGDFSLEDVEPASDDGMDTAFCYVNRETRTLTYAGAKTPIFLQRPGEDEVIQLDGNRKGVGYVGTPMDYQWTNHHVPLESGTRVYVTTDGIIDQIGGPQGIGFGKRRLRELINAHGHKPMTEQQQVITSAFYEYQGSHERRDDVTLFGMTFQ
jgi:serine phosphatase RsbU (regulator of sigma subunit)